ncbi:MAG: hypothetical protein WCA49_12520 [Candidatus Sulfotelmatobacter sp.]
MSMNTPSNSDPKRELFRHALSTLAYRAGKAVRNAPDSFAEFHGGEGLRTPSQILAHMGDLLDWALSIAKGKQAWQNSKPLPWAKEVERFFAALQKFDDFLASGAAVEAPLEKLFQGPVADALTHVGQLAILRRLAGAPVKRENYYKAEITAGRVGADQAAPKLEL